MKNDNQKNDSVEVKQTICFAGSIYQVSVMGEGTGGEKLIIIRDGWNKPLILGGVGN